MEANAALVSQLKRERAKYKEKALQIARENAAEQGRMIENLSERRAAEEDLRARLDRAESSLDAAKLDLAGTQQVTEVSWARLERSLLSLEVSQQAEGEASKQLEQLRRNLAAVEDRLQSEREEWNAAKDRHQQELSQARQHAIDNSHIELLQRVEDILGQISLNRADAVIQAQTLDGVAEQTEIESRDASAETVSDVSNLEIFCDSCYAEADEAQLFWTETRTHIASLEDGLAQSQSDGARAKADLEELSEQLCELRKQTDCLAQDAHRYNIELAVLNSAFEEHVRYETEMLTEVTGLKDNVGSLEQEREQHLSEIRSLKARIEELHVDVATERGRAARVSETLARSRYFRFRSAIQRAIARWSKTAK